jgi:hypothetical protein
MVFKSISKQCFSVYMQISKPKETKTTYSQILRTYRYASLEKNTAVLPCSQEGIQVICQDIGFGSNFEMQLSREHKGANGTILYAINTDFHVTLELPAILNGDDKLQSKFWHSYYSYV